MCPFSRCLTFSTTWLVRWKADGKFCQWFSTGLLQRLEAGCKNQSVWNLANSSWILEQHIHLGLHLFKKKIKTKPQTTPPPKPRRTKNHTATAIADSIWQHVLQTVLWHLAGLGVIQCLQELAVDLLLLCLREGWWSTGSLHNKYVLACAETLQSFYLCV